MLSRSKTFGVGALVLLASSCTHPAPVPRAVPARAPVVTVTKRVKLAVLPVESDSFPRLAASVNALLRDVQVRGVDDYFVSKVALEVVQLSIECVDSTSACMAAVGRSLASDRLLLAQLTA